jgi:hypothetical protein
VTEEGGLPASFFTTQGDGVVTATAATRGPWSQVHQTGSPPAAILVRAIERSLPLAFRVARFTVSFHKPVAITSFRIQTEVVRDGPKVKILRAHLVSIGSSAFSPGPRPVASLEALLVRRASISADGPSMTIPSHGSQPAAESEPFPFPFFLNPVGYHSAMEMRRMHGRFGEGHMGVWMKMRIPLVAGETPSPLERVACAADSGNGISVGVDVARYTFVNPDLTVAIGREPRGAWIGLDARTMFGRDGIGLADACLLDEEGVFGRAVQPLILEPR